MLKTWLVAALAAIVTLSAACSGVGPFEPPPAGGEVLITPINPILGAIGESRQLTLQMGEADDIIDDQSVQWTSSSSNVATVTSSGLVTARGDGTTVITARWNGLQGSTTVLVAATIVATFRITGVDQPDATAGNNAATAQVIVTEE
ncbi:MAG: Ig-like domain-containing protein [Gemmatimonadetes bacterium]|jgi:hypothetical protein|nr:Ig-like domain-containing protein [Gemmatimonadota bacterium]